MPGINLMTYLTCGGFHPARRKLIKETHYEVGHGDVRPWNYILGETLTLIDGHDARNEPDDDAAAHEGTIAAIRWDTDPGERLARFGQPVA